MIAQHFSVGATKTEAASEGTAEMIGSAVPSGLVLTKPPPNVETSGYCRLSLRDRHSLPSSDPGGIGLKSALHRRIDTARLF